MTNWDFIIIIFALILILINMIARIAILKNRIDTLKVSIELNESLSNKNEITLNNFIQVHNERVNALSKENHRLRLEKEELEDRLNDFGIK